MPLPRKIALDIVMRIDNDHSYSNLLLDATLERESLDGRDAAFVTALVYGVIENLICLDYMITHFAGRSAAKLQPKVHNILRLGAYQLVFMDKVPESAAVDSSVRLTKLTGCAYASGFVNAVLRALAKNIQNLPYPDKNADMTGYLSVKYSCPIWLIEKWMAAYGEEITLGLLGSLGGRPPAAARVNTLKVTPQALIDILKNDGLVARISPVADAAIELESLPNLRRIKAFDEGLFIMQDYASQLCCMAVGAGADDTVIDMCAAPGGKSFTLGFMMQGRGKITACDLADSRVSLIEQGARRLGLEGLITAVRSDATRHSGTLGLADKVLCDVPCSGLGVIRRKPEIRYKKPESFDLLPDLQYIILCEGATHVVPGGRLVYSTCTLSPDENEEIAKKFLKNNPSFAAEPLEKGFFAAGAQPCHYVTLFPHLNGTDGFFIARFKNNRQV